jgi:hypothetical protein
MMGLLDWLKSNKTEVSHCINCGTETGSKVLCNACNSIAEFEYEFYCDGCGNDYPKTHLVYDHRFDGHFCDNCHTWEGEE